jgi:hypothetical protein
VFTDKFGVFFSNISDIFSDWGTVNPLPMSLDVKSFPSSIDSASSTSSIADCDRNADDAFGAAAWPFQGASERGSFSPSFDATSCWNGVVSSSSCDSSGMGSGW